MAEPSTSNLALSELLKSLGLTKYEALVYIGLLREPGSTATRIHEITGVPRASVYPVLERLTHKNLVSVSLATPRRFEAVPPDEGIDRLLDVVSADAERAKKILSRVWRERSARGPADQDFIWSIYGIENIRPRLVDLLRHATASIDILLYGSLFPDELPPLVREMAGTIPVRVTTNCPEMFAGTGVMVRTIPAPPAGKDERGFAIAGGVFLVDHERAIVVMVAGEEATALLSESRGFVKFFSTYLELVSLPERDPL
ncbi:MAG: TrmB family transcriptional regulator [Methanolinea sp.]|nr:TrmB family transcriptional regulator [Methanolinea sp.]